MLSRKGNHHCWIFRALRLVNSDRIGGDDLIEFAEVILDQPAIVIEHELLSIRVNRTAEAEIAVEDLFVVVVDRLHHLIAAPERASEAGDHRFALITIQSGLKVEIERPRTDAASVHGAEHLYLADGIESELCRNAVVHELDDFAGGVVGLLGFNEIEV